ncbi:hypothetical protein V8D89_007233 [Ganoderma adspersum]
MHYGIIITSRLSPLLISYSIIIHPSPQKSDWHQYNIATHDQSPAVVPIQDLKLSPTPNPPPAAGMSDIDMPVVSSCTSCPAPSGAPHRPVIMIQIRSRSYCFQSHHARPIRADRNDELSMSQSAMHARPGAVHSWKPLTSRRQPLVLCAVSVSISDRNVGRAYGNLTRNPRCLSQSRSASDSANENRPRFRHAAMHDVAQKCSCVMIAQKGA